MSVAKGFGLKRIVCIAFVLTTVLCVTHAHTPPRAVDVLKSRPAVKALQERLKTEQTLSASGQKVVGSPIHPASQKSRLGERGVQNLSCGTPTTKGTLRSYGRDQQATSVDDNVCFATICDDPAHVLGYEESLKKGLVEKVTARVKVYSIGKDDFSEPFSNAEKTQFQKEVMDAYYKDTYIDFVFEDFIINSTFIWHGEITPYSCPPEKLGNGVPDWECLAVYNGFDGGDWLCPNHESCNPICTFRNISYSVPGTEDCTCICYDYSGCQESMVGDGVCQDVCNVAPKKYDGGDCCQDATLGKCFDHKRPLFERSFADISEIREYVKSNYSNHLYIYVGTLETSYLLGISVFPWTIDFDSSFEGGLLMEKSVWGDGPNSTYHGSVVPHEAGHSFGLWHTFHGVSELYEGCDDPCYEAQYAVGGEGTMLKGDLCADTRPTPMTFECSDPEPCPEGIFDLSCSDCKNKAWVDTPVENIMGYSDPVGICYDQEFSPQQHGRMRCYYDLYYADWDESPLPGHIALPPRVKRVSDNKMEVSWSPPLNKGNGGALYFIIRRTPAFDGGDISVSATEYLDTSVQKGVTYGYQVKAGNSAGEAPNFSIVETESKKAGDESLSGGAIAGIVVGSVAGGVALVGVASYILKPKSARSEVNMHPVDQYVGMS